MARKYRKSIYFFNFELTLISDGENAAPIRGSRFKEVVEDVFDQKINPLNLDGELVVDRITSNDKYFFGSVGKIADLSENRRF